MKEKLNKAYKEKLTNFYKKIEEEFPNQSELLSKIPGIHIPGFGSDYPSAKRKILYMGIDTKGWGSVQEELQSFKNPDYSEKAILYSCKELEEFKFWDWFKPQKENGNTGTSSFWNVVVKIHLSLKGISFSEPITLSDKSKYENDLKDFAWGNTHSIETYQHAKENYNNDALEYDFYKKIQNLTKPFDDLEFIIDTLTPDAVIIMNGSSWETDTWKNYFSKLELEKEETDVKCWKYKSKSGVPVYWLNHPTSGGYFGDHQGIIEYFKKELNEV